MIRIKTVTNPYVFMEGVVRLSISTHEPEPFGFNRIKGAIIEGPMGSADKVVSISRGAGIPCRCNNQNRPPQHNTRLTGTRIL